MAAQSEPPVFVMGPRARAAVIWTLMGLSAWAVVADSLLLTLTIPAMGIFTVALVLRHPREYTKYDVGIFVALLTATVIAVLLFYRVNHASEIQLGSTSVHFIIISELVLFAGLVGNAMITANIRKLSVRARTVIMCSVVGVLARFCLTELALVAVPVVILTAFTLMAYHKSDTTLPKDRWI